MRKCVMIGVISVLVLSGCSATHEIDQRCEAAAESLTGDLSYTKHGGATEDLAVDRLEVLRELRDDVHAIEPLDSDADPKMRTWMSALDTYIADVDEVVGYYQDEEMALDLVRSMQYSVIRDSAKAAGSAASAADLSSCADSGAWEAWE